MPEGISNYVTPVNYPSNPWIDRGNYSLYESTVSDIICLSFESKSFRYQIGYEVSPELSKVEDYVPGTRGRELAKTLESDSLVSYGWLPREENMYDIIFEWSPTESAVMSARRISLPLFEVPFHGVSWSRELTLPTSAVEEWFTEYFLDAQPEEITGAAVFECVSAKVLEQIKVWGVENQVETALGIVRETFRSLYGYEVAISTDPEIPGRKIIRITLTVSGNPEDVYKDERRLKNRLYSVLDNKALELIAIVYHWEA